MISRNRFLEAGDVEQAGDGDDSRDVFSYFMADVGQGIDEVKSYPCLRLMQCNHEHILISKGITDFKKFLVGSRTPFDERFDGAVDDQVSAALIK